MSQELTVSRKIDRIEAAMAKLPQRECPLVHTFTPHLYSRQITMPKNTLIVSRIHKTEHPFVISKGEVSVWTADRGVVRLRAPHIGITRPGTRRILFIHEECVWLTFHVTDETDPEKVVSTVTEDHVLGGEYAKEGADIGDIEEIMKQLSNGEKL